jgi:hypothetical protein
MDGGGRDIKAIVAKPHETKPSTCEGYELRRIARIVGRRSMWDRRVDDPGRDRKRKPIRPRFVSNRALSTSHTKDISVISKIGLLFSIRKSVGAEESDDGVTMGWRWL